jgi:tRNA pseudouridine38/39 synthase
MNNKILLGKTDQMLKRMASKYIDWSREALVERISQLEQQLGKHAPKFQKEKPQRSLDFSKYSTRFIALKFSYLGWNYNGLAIQKEQTPLPTVEGTVLEAMAKCRLIPSISLQEIQFSRCGRTDRGVSAMNQVISLRVRSNLTPEEQQDPSNDPRELDYLNILNSLLPSDVKMHSLCLRPPEGFDARFSCISRHYKYIFHGADLDIEAMNIAAGYYEGEHDFRNFCKLDGSKQITNFKRTILKSQILEIEPGFYCFDLEGSAFLWHQVRNMIAVLFLVGQKLESAEIIKDLINVEKYPQKPVFDMAADFPLVLYDCKFPEMEWMSPQPTAKHNRTTTTVYSNWLETKIRSHVCTFMMDSFPKVENENSTRINLGNGKGKVLGHYVPIEKRERQESYEIVNDRWAKKQKLK